jgi:CBS domain-containing protein
MAATLGGMMRAPIMAVMFAFELTFDQNALLPLLTAAGVAYGFTVLFMKRSILTEKIARRGYHIYREYGIDPLERHIVKELMTGDVRTIDAEMPIKEVLETYFGTKQTHRAYPVVRAGALVGMIDRDALLAGRDNTLALKVSDLFGANVPIMALPNEICRIVSNRLAVHHLERLPVVADAQSRKLVGVISRSDLVKPSLAFAEEEDQRERFRHLAPAMLRRKKAKSQEARGRAA